MAFPQSHSPPSPRHASPPQGGAVRPWMLSFLCSNAGEDKGEEGRTGS